MIRIQRLETYCNEVLGVVRVTADCPLLDPDVVETVISRFRGLDGCDYASNMLEPTFPYGMAVEAMSFAALSQAHNLARDPVEREHVTPYIYRRPGQFRIESVEMSPNRSDHRWTVDTPEDFELVRLILEALYPSNPDFRMAHVVALLDISDGTRPDDPMKHHLQPQLAAAGIRYVRIPPTAIPKPAEAKELVYPS